MLLHMQLFAASIWDTDLSSVLDHFMQKRSHARTFLIYGWLGSISLVSSRGYMPDAIPTGFLPFHVIRAFTRQQLSDGWTGPRLPSFASAVGQSASQLAQVSTENVVIIGSGPAGYTAGIYCARANLKPLIFEGAQTTGGQLMATSHVENFPGFPEGILGPDLISNMRRQAARWGSELETDDVAEINLSKRPFRIRGQLGRVVEAYTIIIATGASAKKLNLPNEDAYWSRGITACAICDGAAPMFRDEPLAVVGGGDSAAEEAVYLTKYSPEIHLLVRGTQMRASKAMQDRVLSNPRITIHYGTEIVQVIGDDPEQPFTGSPVKCIIVKGKETPEKKLPVRGIFYAIGHRPMTDLFKPYVELDGKGYIVVKPGTAETSKAGVFAAGDVQDPLWRQAITAAGTGCMAALAAERYLSERDLITEYHQPQPPSVSPYAAAPALIEPVEEGDEDEETEEEEIKRHSAPSRDSQRDVNLDDTYFSSGHDFVPLRQRSPKPVLVMFMSKTCGPCRILKPIMSRVLKEFEGRLHYVEVDIEEFPELTLEAGVGGTPTVQLYHKGEIRSTMRGVKKSSEYKEEILKCV